MFNETCGVHNYPTDFVQRCVFLVVVFSDVHSPTRLNHSLHMFVGVNCANNSTLE
ncbi:hypothetical protein HanIR_Chr06g0267401 [Helianthus annuus]|nr:hypothetical protein HanIR_Chr06g0267401 [Helianthus annuus]